MPLKHCNLIGLVSVEEHLEELLKYQRNSLHKADLILQMLDKSFLIQSYILNGNPLYVAHME